ncbi:expressed unknown protein [Seminavis robusta]|uniref:SET domain-containing protein n=1 Tax=Seminavis robusta TaxID=568900 RepID=A0A9N8DY53_9STRA|nr:expressed unknown protein [Seminavis robusta]|eukprot:Sro466_g148780.1 n/a (418) ;mRNA; f:21824-23077
MLSYSRTYCLARVLFLALALLTTFGSSFSSLDTHHHHYHQLFKTTTTPWQQPIRRTLRHATQQQQTSQDLLDTFESWFSSVAPPSAVHGSIRHAFFGNLRGLEWTASPSSTPSAPVISVPLSLVLQSDIQDSTDKDDWDSNLARQLWSECLLGDQSKLSGYCDFLTQGRQYLPVPLSTAPNALRHWKKEERQALQQSTAGKKVLELELAQQELWKTKYDKGTNGNDNNNMSWEQFQWAMEVVHSRAFRGNFGSKTGDHSDQNTVLSLLPTVVPPLAAAVGGLVYVQSTPYPNDVVLAGLGALAVAPLVINLQSSSSPSAVLLPMIDSANHQEDADSKIEYDPLTKCFQMSIGPKCLIQPSATNGDDHPQLCVSYGKRSDAELLLNYGFLPEVSLCSDDVSLSEQRARLADAFNQRNY